MRVLMYMDSSGAGVPGGHRRQMDKTAEFLRRQNVKVDIAADIDASAREYDIAHNFGVAPRFITNAIHCGTPVAISTIYWERDCYFNSAGILGRAAALRENAVYRLKAGLDVLLTGQPAIHERVGLLLGLEMSAAYYRAADILLPNARAEGDAVIRECGADPERVHFVPNAVDTAPMHAAPTLFEKEYGLRDFVLCVGRVEPRKNQMRLIQAMRGMETPLVIVDPVHPEHAVYRAQCQKIMGKNVTYLTKLPDAMLQSAYAAAKVHVLPSFYETTGLVTLEAALAGCNVVVNEQAHTREYFQDYAWYCDPFDPASIRKAIEAACRAPFQDRLRQRILDNFTWEHTARATLAGYEKALAFRRVPAPAR